MNHEKLEREWRTHQSRIEELEERMDNLALVVSKRLAPEYDHAEEEATSNTIGLLQEHIDELEGTIAQQEQIIERQNTHLQTLQEENTALRGGHGVTYHIAWQPDGDV